MEGIPFGRYRLQELLGRGGMGEVWRAYDTSTDRVVALKLLPAQWAEDQGFQERFRREAHAAARLNEPHIVPIHGYGEIENRLYVEMRLIDGQDLQTVLDNGPLLPARAVAIIEQIAMALDAVHQSGLVHRDVKPSNILIARYDFAYLIDFGIARADQETKLTSAGQIIGTVHYMAPERFRHNDSDPRADVYALTCVLAQCLTGSVPFPAAEPERQMMAHLTAPPPRPSQINPAVPEDFDAVIAKGMAKNPVDRFQTTLELSAATHEVLGTTAGKPGADPANAKPVSAQAIEPAATLLEDVPASADSECVPVGEIPPSDNSQRATGAAINELLDRAVSALNSAADPLVAAPADQPAVVEHNLGDVDDMWSSHTGSGEIRRMTILSADLVDPTRLAMQLEPETYRLLIRRYREQVRKVTSRYEGHLGASGGDGVLVLFGYPRAHEDDVYRAVQAGLEITREVERLSEQVERRFDTPISVRVGVHRGVVYLDNIHDDAYGLTADLASQVSALAPPGGVAVTRSVEPLIRDAFSTELLPTASDGVTGDVINPFRIISERIKAVEIPLGPLLGRDRELARLQKSWARAQAGTLVAPAVVLRGEAGIGKSRLAASTSDIVQRAGGRILEFVGSPVHSDVGLYPLRVLLERRCGITWQTEPARRLRQLQAEVEAQGLDLDTTIPLLAPVIGLDALHGYQPVEIEGHKLQDLIATAVKRYLLACFGDEAGLLLAEDAHWFDKSTLTLLGSLLSDTAGRLLVVITGRDGAWLPEQWSAKVFDLLPFSDNQSDELTRALDPTVSPEDCAAVRARCGGIPYYIEQVVGALAPADDSDRPSVPDRLYEPLFARLDASENVVPVVAAAAIIGRNVERGLLVAASSLSEDEIDDVTDELENAKVFVPQGTDAWRFRHELLREAAMEFAPPSMRRDIHAKIADAMTQGAAGDPDWRQVAAHYEHADRHKEAASAYARASADARRRGALDEARAYLTHALTQLDHCPPGSERDRDEIQPRLERWFLASTAEGYQSPAVTSDVERCLQLLGRDLSEDQLFGTLFAVCSYFINKADLQRASQLADALRVGTEAERQWWSPAIECIHGMIAFMRGQYADARDYFERAKVGFREDDQHSMELWFIPHDAVAMAYDHLAIYHVLHGDVAAAEDAITKAMQRADGLGFPSGPYNHVYAIDMECWMRSEAGQFDRARALVIDMMEKAERYGFEFWQGFGHTVQSRVDSDSLLRSAEPDAEAVTAQIDIVTQFTDLWRSVGLFAYQTHYDCIIGQLLTAAGRRDEAQTRINTALQLADDTGMHFFDAELLRARAHTHSDPDTRAADLGVAIQLSRQQDAPLFELRAALDDFELRGDAARDALKAAACRLVENSMLPEATRARSILAQVD